ncbi:aminoacyl-tRNA hydrolase [Lapillicoccus jejuensis]|uniref:Peptidyl-tRNA hydrolase n=1 Tax=Lapillicoccus jejuensis TaxID=402171 RepID=A0A542E1F7_9MICO|nr:aminoacyl-tRNA hydrolase [Lapillicoccus jejuensis]TQJ09176.1 peptidyl-tRNA hydrolase [Lapillicoccus jejuensis]
MTTDTWLVVGLGNPGATYAGNRHNVGAMAVHELAARHDPGAAAGRGRRTATPTFRTHKARATVCEVRLGTAPGGAPGPRAVLAVPSTYMNESGGPVKALLGFFSVPVERLVVVHDELDIPSGDVRVKLGGGEGGHNGLRSITASVGTKDYLRVRVGIGRPPGRMDPADFVLRDFGSVERAELPFTLDTAADAVESLVAVGLLDTQQRFHGADRPTAR